MLDLSLYHIKMKYYDDIVLEDVHFDVHTGQTIGLVGNNGCGKTSLFRVIVGQEQPQSGAVQLRSGLTIGYLPQVPAMFNDLSVEQVLALPFAELLALEDDLRRLESAMADTPSDQSLLNRYSDIQFKYEHRGGYQIASDTERVVTGFQLQPLLKQSYQALSGGEKTRVALAKILLEKPDVLLLDEPTNHLDMDMLNWLEQMIADYRGAVIVISHDRYFLDQVADKIVEIASGVSTVYHGNYSLYQIEKQRAFERQLKAYHEQQRLIKNIQRAISRFRLWGAKGDNEKFFDKARQFQKRLDDMPKIDKPSDDVQHFDIALQTQAKSSKRMIMAEDIAKYYGAKVLFKALNFEVLRGERICLIGQNGTGKSTILKAILGEDKLDYGVIKVAPSVAIGYLAQEIQFADEQQSIVDYVCQQAVLVQGEARNLLAQYGFKGQEVFRRINTLSGGEKSRIILMLFTRRQYNLMLLDEPTNHLDIQSKEKLEAQLEDFMATLFFISHDRYFINRIATSILHLENGQITRYTGNYDDYVAQRHRAEQSAHGRQVRQSVNEKSDSNKKKNTGNQHKIREKNLAVLETTIDQLESKIDDIAMQMKQCGSDYQQLQQLQAQLDNAIQLRDQQLADWLKLSE